MKYGEYPARSCGILRCQPSFMDEMARSLKVMSEHDFSAAHEQWLSDSPDLVNGVGLAKDAAGILWKPVSLALDAEVGLEMFGHLRSGELAEFTIDAAKYFSGKSTINFLKNTEINIQNRYIQEGASTAAGHAVEAAAAMDCSSC
jgi:hypothetical protein